MSTFQGIYLTIKGEKKQKKEKKANIFTVQKDTTVLSNVRSGFLEM